jgi:glycerophosphoryl diester phosphodiesterase
MLIIGHRGAAGLAAENTLEALQSGIDAGADMLEFDVQITRDKQLLVVHDSTLLRTHKKSHIVRWSTHQSIKEATEKGHKIATLEEVLDMFFGNILLNLEIKSHGTGKHVIDLLEKKYIHRKSDWENVLLSSFKANELVAMRKKSPHAELAMLHNRNPFTFMAYHRKLNLTAVGFHRLRANSLSIEVAKQLNIFIYLYTVNRKNAAKRFAQEGIDGIVTDNPKLLKGMAE